MARHPPPTCSVGTKSRWNQISNEFPSYFLLPQHNTKKKRYSECFIWKDVTLFRKTERWLIIAAWATSKRDVLTGKTFFRKKFGFTAQKLRMQKYMKKRPENKLDKIYRCFYCFPFGYFLDSPDALSVFNFSLDSNTVIQKVEMRFYPK